MNQEVLYGLDRLKRSCDEKYAKIEDLQSEYASQSILVRKLLNERLPPSQLAELRFDISRTQLKIAQVLESQERLSEENTRLEGSLLKINQYSEGFSKSLQFVIENMALNNHKLKQHSINVSEKFSILRENHDMCLEELLGLRLIDHQQNQSPLTTPAIDLKRKQLLALSIQHREATAILERLEQEQKRLQNTK